MGIDVMRALVLEDSDRVMELYRKIFEQKNHSVEFVPDVASCIDAIRNGAQYDCVILEEPIRMREDANLEDEIRKTSPNQRVFFLSPYLSMRGDGFENLRDTLNLIDKPFAMVSLLSYLEIKNPMQAAPL